MNRPIVWDNHGCMPLRADDSFLPQLQRYKDAGVTMASLNVGFGEMGWDEHLEVLTYMRDWIGARPDEYRLVTTAADVRASARDGKLGVAFDIEGMVPVQDDPSRVAQLYDLGVRWMLIAYNRNNKAGGGCLDEDGGLTDIGRAIIAEMERVGMVLCLSHAGARTVAEALELSTNPPIFSHSNPFGVTPHPRNVSDELMLACARKGGVVGLSGIGGFLGVTADPVAALLNHLRYVIDLVGPAHVGLGIDVVFDQAELQAFLKANPSMFAASSHNPVRVAVEPEDTPAIADGLSRLGLSDADVRAVMGENWLRIAEQVWR